MLFTSYKIFVCLFFFFSINGEKIVLEFFLVLFLSPVLSILFLLFTVKRRRMNHVPVWEF